jgi:predicted phage-related endonuclease
LISKKIDSRLDVECYNHSQTGDTVMIQTPQPRAKRSRLSLNLPGQERTVAGAASREEQNELADVSSSDGCEAAGSLWPRLDRIGLDANQLAWRREGIGGSDANIILSGDAEPILRLWREKRSEEEGEDLSHILQVMLGQWTEAFNRQWYQRHTGNLVVDPGAAAVCPIHDWRRCTLDGFIYEMGAIWEAKHTSAFAKPEEVLARYMPQLQHNMVVRGADRAILSVIYGNHKWEAYEVASDWMYQDELLEAESRFWACVQSGAQPAALPPPPPPRPVAVREVCLEGNNSWASAAIDWLKHAQAARIHAGAVKELKALIGEDVSRAYGHGIEARRSKAGAISIREMA